VNGYERVVAARENHQIMNGLGSAVAAVLSERKPTLMKRVGVRDALGAICSLDHLKECYGLGRLVPASRRCSSCRLFVPGGARSRPWQSLDLLPTELTWRWVGLATLVREATSSPQYLYTKGGCHGK